MKSVLKQYEFTKRMPRKEEISELPNYKLGLFKRDGILNDLLSKTQRFIEKFYIGF